ncbi:uncharacterized protein LOC143806507 [Ranitomeya variabilis]|uniref:uncharacterized protein LOC143806507 n=1 Tax=Ranitomeya variabilis TaxID=490064 RepID=UPI004056C169
MELTLCLSQMFPLKTGIIIFNLISLVAGNLDITRIEPPIQALLGHNITVPCHFLGYKTSPLDLSKVSVRWTMKTPETNETRVYFFDGTRHIADRPGSRIPDSGLMEGNGSLYLPNLQFSDEGEYTCSIIVTPAKETSKVSLQISAEPTCTLSDSGLEMNPDTERSVTCYVNGYYPKPVTIQWVKYSKASSNSKLDSRTCTTEPVLSQNETYNVTNVLSVKPKSTDEDRDVYSCVITHRSLKDKLTCNVTLSVTAKEGHSTAWIVVGTVVTIAFITVALAICYYYCTKASPTVSEITKEDLIHLEKSTLKCYISGFRPQDLTITLYLKNGIGNEIEVCSWNSKKNRNKSHNNNNELEIPLQSNNDPICLDPIVTRDKLIYFNCICGVHITPIFQVHHGAVLTMKIQHGSLPLPICKDLSLRVQTIAKLDPIRTTQNFYHVGDLLDLECRIHSFYPNSIQVLWYKDTEIIFEQDIKANTKENSLYYVTSSVQHTVREEDFWKTFRCKVTHQSKTSEYVNWKLKKTAQPSLDSNESILEISDGNQQ